MPYSFVVKNGSKRWFWVASVHAGARVSDFDHHVGTRYDIRVQGRVPLAEIHRGAAYAQCATARHRFAGVRHQIEDNLLHLSAGR